MRRHRVIVGIVLAATLAGLAVFWASVAMGDNRIFSSGSDERPSTGIGGADKTSLPPDKRNLLDEMETRFAAARERTSYPLARPTPALDAHTPPPITPGLKDLPQPFGKMMWSNAWKEYVGDGITEVFAGWDQLEPEQGVLLVQVRSLNRDLLSSTVFRTSDKVGALRIESVSGTVLNITAANGDLFTFDAATSEFVEAAVTPEPPTAAASVIALETPKPPVVVVTEPATVVPESTPLSPPQAESN